MKWVVEMPRVIWLYRLTVQADIYISVDHSAVFIAEN